MSLISLAIPVLTRLAPALVGRFIGRGERSEGLAGVALELVRQISGVDDLDEAARVIQQDPDKLLEFQAKLAEQETAIEQAYLLDRQDARQREIEMRKLGHVDWPMYLIGSVVTSGFILVCLVTFFTQDLSEVQERLLSVLIGMLGTGFIAVVSYYFGSSQGSKAKTDALLHGGQGVTRS